MSDFVSYISSLNSIYVTCVVLLTGTGAFIIYWVMESRLVTAVFGSAFLGGALLASYVAAAFGVFLTEDRETDFMVLSTIGMIVGLGAVLVLYRLACAIWGPGRRVGGGGAQAGLQSEPASKA